MLDPAEVRVLIDDWTGELETLKAKRAEMEGRAQSEGGMDPHKAAAAADSELTAHYQKWTGRKLSLPIARKLGIAGA